jgi:alpha 1,3-glucosidase
MSSVKSDDSNVIGQLFDSNNPTAKLRMVLSLTQRGAIRMKIDELEPTRQRFEAKEALNPNLAFNKLSIDNLSDDQCSFVFGYPRNDGEQQAASSKQTNYKLILRSSPFQAEVLDPNGKTVVLVNSKGLMRFEEHRELNSGTVKPELFGAPRQAKAYDEAGRPIDNQPSESTEESHGGDQPQSDEKQEPSNNEVQSYAETFSTFTDIRPFGPMSVGVDIYFPNSDYVYGIPEHADNFALKDTRPNIGDPYRLYNVDIFEYETYTPMSLYGAIPFMMAQSKSVGTFGVFWLNPSETWIDIESNHSQSRSAGVVDMISSFVSSDKKMTGRLTHWFSETGLIDIWFMPGPEPTNVVSYNAEIFGTIPLPPMYSIGFHQCRWNYYSGEEVMSVSNNYDAVETPLDAVWLDVEYTAGRSKKYFTWDSATFPNPIKLANNLTSKGRRLITIIDPHIKKEDGYTIYDEGTSLDLWVKDASGQNTYEGWCWPGASVWPDYLNPKVSEWWSKKFDPAHFPGDKDCLVDIWNDMNEPSVFNGPEVSAPRDLRHYQGFEHRDIHNMYGFLMTKATFEGMSKYRPNDRPFILTRSFFAGSQRNCAAWTGDNQARWDHLKITIPMLLSLSVSGMPNVGADVGGFFNNPDEELIVRWHQAGAFQPFFRNHAHHDARHREIYLYQGQTLDLLRSAIQLRYSYAPYWYSLFHESHSTGMPMMRPHWFHEPQDEATYGLEDQYLLGYALLVKPILEQGVSSTEVYLPGAAGQTAWFDLRNHVMHQGGKYVNLAVDINSVPLFQRAGTIIPRQYRMRRSLELLAKDPITLDIVLGENQGKAYAHGSLYVDDYKKQKPDAQSSTLKDILFYDEYLYVKPSTDAKLSHGVIERLIIYNWPSEKRIKSIHVAPEENNYANSQALNFRLDRARQDGTTLLEIRRPQLSPDWKVWMLKIEV